MIAAIYARYSSDRQREESIADQCAACAERIRSEGWTPGPVYTDSAVTGRTSERDGLHAMLDGAEAGAFGVLLVYKRDRLARDRFVMADIRRRLKKAGVQLVAVMESIPDGPEGILLESLLDGLAEYYSENLANHVRRGMRSNAERCHPNGVRVFGYRICGDHYEVDESEARYVRRAFELYAGNKPWDFAEEFGHLRGRQGRPWHPQRVSKMVRDERYRGVYRWGDVRVEGGMPRIIDDETFFDVQSRLGKPKRRCAGKPLALRGKLVYPDGTPVATTGTRKNGREYKYYILNGEYFAQDALEEACAETIAHAIEDDAVADRIVAAIMREWESLDDSAAREAVERDIRDAEREYGNLCDVAAKRPYNAILAARMDECEDRIDALRMELARLESERRIVTPEVIRAWLGIMRTAPAGELLSSFLSRGIVRDGCIELHCYFDDPGDPGGDGFDLNPDGGLTGNDGEPVAVCAYGFAVSFDYRRARRSSRRA